MCIAEARRHKQIRECCQGYWHPSGPTSQSSRSACHTRSRVQRTQCKDLLCRTRRNMARSCRNPLTSLLRAQFQHLDLSRATPLRPDRRPKRVSNHLPRPSPKERRRGTWRRHVCHARRPISGRCQAALPSQRKNILIRARCDGTFETPFLHLASLFSQNGI